MTGEPLGGPEPYALVVLGPEDTVGIAVRDLTAGVHRTSSGADVQVLEPVALGHKVALRARGAGSPVVRSGMVIGSATRAIPPGAWVHTHNLSSNYIETFAHRGGEP